MMTKTADARALISRRRYLGPTPALRHLLDIAGSASGEQALLWPRWKRRIAVLEYWCEKYSSPVAVGATHCFHWSRG